MTLVNEQARILNNKNVGPNLYLMTVESPYITEHALPGQFVHVKIPSLEAHILRRPLGIYATDPTRGVFDMLYQVVGAGTDHMTSLTEGTTIEIIGPIGQGWSVPEGTKHALIVGGGVGAAPLYMLAKQLSFAGIDVQTILGSQTSAMLVFNERYERVLGAPPVCSTDDGTFGFSGFCTPLVELAIKNAQAENTPYDYLAVCGPEPLMRIVASMAEEANIFCEVSMEKRMACGIGACLSCVVDTVDGKKRACVDGPVFNAKEVVW